MRMLVLGASGGCGSWLTRLAAAAGHEVTALVRHGSSWSRPEGIEVLTVSELDPACLDRAVEGQDAVFSCLGLRRAGASPWAPLRSPPDLTGRTTRLLIPAMRRHGVQRLVAISAGGVGESAGQLSGPVRWLVRTGNVGVAYRDLASMEAEIAESGLSSLIVRPVTLKDGEPTGRAAPVERYSVRSAVRRADVAAWMLEAGLGRPWREGAVLLGTR